jgi:photosystem II stability/assembly factor-like uncharacterized protein
LDGGHTWTELHQFSGAAYSLNSVNFADADYGWASLTNCTRPRESCDFVQSFEFTSDGGATWTAAEIAATSGRTFDVTSSGVVAAMGGETGIAYFETSGTAWQASETNAGPEPGRVEFISADVGFAYGNNAARLTTHDGGANWTQQEEGSWWSAVAPGLLARWPQNGDIQISEDAGDTWRVIEPPPSERPDSGWVVAAVDDRIWVTFQGVPWRTDDGGRTWRRLVTYGRADYQFIDEEHAWIAPGGASGVGASILMSSDAGESWTESPLPHRAVQFVFRSPQQGWGVTVDYSRSGGEDPDCLCIIGTRDGGTTWNSISTAPWQIRTLVVDSGGDLWGLSQLNYDPPVIVTSSDGGATWRADYRMDGPYSATLVGKGDRLWLYYSNSKGCFLHGPCEAPRGTVIYRRDTGP